MDDRFDKDSKVFKRPESNLYEPKDEIPWDQAMPLEEYFYQAFLGGHENRPAVTVLKKISPDAFEKARRRFVNGKG